MLFVRLMKAAEQKLALFVNWCNILEVLFFQKCAN